MAYETGSIGITVETLSDQTISKLNSIIAVLNRIDVSLEKPISSLNRFSRIKVDNLRNNLQSISNLDFSALASAFKPIESIDAKKLSSVNRQLNNFSRLNFDNIDFRRMYEQVSTLTRIIDPFITKIQKAEPSLRAFVNALDLGRVNAQMMVAEARVNSINSKTQSRKVLDDIKIEKANLGLENTKKRLEEINNKADKTQISFNKIFNIGKLYFWLNYTKRISNVLTNWFQSAIAFDETLNKFQVSMGEYIDNATRFANQLTQAFNLSKQSVLDYMSTFNNMLSALGGLEDDTSYYLSETLTRMAIDYASLFNVGIETAMNQFQQVLSGQIRGIRSTSGYDVSEQTIFTLYQELGGTKTMRQLSQLEKRLLRILAIQKQMSETQAVGDFAKTLSTSANMLKQISETMQELGRWIGNLFMTTLKPMIEGVLVLSITLKEIVKSMAIMSGYKETLFEAGEGFDFLKDSADGANEAIDELTGKLLSFDKFESLNPTENNTSSDLQNIIESLATYQTSLTEITNKANKTADSILEWLGLTKELDPVTEEIVYKLKDGYTNIELIKDSVLSLVSIGLGVMLVKTITSIGTLVNSLTSLNGSLSLMKYTLATLISLSLIKFIEAMQNGDTKAQILWGSILALTTVFTILKYRLQENVALMGIYMIDALKNLVKSFTSAMYTMISKIMTMTIAYDTLSIAIGGVLMIVSVFFISKMNEMSASSRTWIGALLALAGAITAVAVAYGAFQSVISWGTAIPAILGGVIAVGAGITGVVSGVKEQIQTFATGGYPNEGQLFIANEAGAELVGNIGGRTAVANNDMIVQAIENASYRGYSRAMQENKTRDNTYKLVVDGSRVDNSAFARAIYPALKIESERSSG